MSHPINSHVLTGKNLCIYPVIHVLLMHGFCTLYAVPRFTGKTRITGKTTKIPERPKNNREILICPTPIKKAIIDYWILLIFEYLVYI